MKITYEYYKATAKKRVAEEAYPVHTENLWKYDAENGVYFSKPVNIKIWNDSESAMLRLQLWMGYHRCCGLREFGAVEFTGNNGEFAALVKAFKELPFFKYLNCGALLYTEVKDSHGELVYPEGSWLISLWPGSKNVGEWWYNPNSGHYCRNVTLSLDAGPVVYNDDDEEDD